MSLTLGTLNDRVRLLIRERILSGELTPGSRILETELASELAVGRGTVRSALQQLSMEHLVVQKRFHSTFVVTATAQDIYEIYTLRNALEALACRLAAERMTSAAAESLSSCLVMMATAAAANDKSAVVDADYAFHRTIFAIAGHSRLLEHYLLIEAQTRLYLNLTSEVDYDLVRILEVHERLAQVILSGDGPAAENLARDHNTADGERMTVALREKEIEPE